MSTRIWNWWTPPQNFDTPLPPDPPEETVRNLNYWDGAAWVEVDIAYWDGAVWVNVEPLVNHWGGAAWET